MYKPVPMYKVVPVYMVIPAYIVVLLFASLLWASVAEAARNFPQNARRGTITEHQYPHYKIGSSIYRIAAGGRIYNQSNLIIMPASFYGQAEVMYRLDINGQLSAIWLLTREEAAMHPNPNAPERPEESRGR
jgi:hypothetical protein